MEVKDLHLVEEPKKVLRMNPKKFALWLFIVSIVMIFASLTSAYIVKMADGEWLIYDLPTIFWINSIIILMSSATMQWAVVSARKDNITIRPPVKLCQRQAIHTRPAGDLRSVKIFGEPDRPHPERALLSSRLL